MKNLFRIAFVQFTLMALGMAAGDEKKEGIAGTWSGEITIFGMELPIVFEFKSVGNGQYSAVMRSPSQTDKDIPVNTVFLRDRDLNMTVDIVGGRYKGKVGTSGTSIRGDWTQGGNTLPLNLKFQEGGYVFKRPQTPKAPFPYDVVEAQIPNQVGTNNHQLTGLLTKPKRPVRPVPAVVLISGSGPQDRDEFIAGHRPFAVIADYLTRKGIAVLRYDDRGVGESTGTFEYGTTMDFATDAYAAVDWLKTQKDIDPGKIGLIGHSEGGLIAPIVVTKREDIAFIVMLAGPGLRGDKTLLSQSKALGEAAGLPPEFMQLNFEFSTAVYEALNAPQPDPEKLKRMGAEFEKKAKALDLKDLEKLGGAADFGEMWANQLKMIESHWFRNFVKLDPGEYLQRVTCPVLALNGEKDLQVIADLQLPAVQGHLNTAGNKNVDARVLKDLNHLFQRAETGLPSEYSKIEETIAPSVLKLLGDWIAKTAGM